MTPAPGRRSPSEPRPLTDGEFRRFRSLIYGEAGIDLPDSKKMLLARRLARRIKELELASYGRYYERIEADLSGRELTRMLDDIATNETHFFREPRQFEFLERSLIPAWKAAAEAGRRSRRVKIWSAACSTGEEPFSLAMTLLEQLPAVAGWEVDILATDLSTRALETAARAVWPVERLREIPERLSKKFMLRGKRSMLGRMKAGPAMRSAVRFARLNLYRGNFPVDGPFDLILCRNVLIYFDEKSRLVVLERLLRHLDPDGHLFVGHAESLTSMTHQVRSLIPTVYRPVVPGHHPRHGRPQSGVGVCS